MHLSLGDSPDPTTLTYPRDLLIFSSLLPRASSGATPGL